MNRMQKALFAAMVVAISFLLGCQFERLSTPLVVEAQTSKKVGLLGTASGKLMHTPAQVETALDLVAKKKWKLHSVVGDQGYGFLVLVEH